MRRKALAMAAFAAAAAGGAAMGWAGERRALRHTDPAMEPQWRELNAPIAARSQTVESFDGTSLLVEITGPEDAPTIVMAHGYALSKQAWHYQRRELAGAYRVVVYDQRGHGGSEEAAGGDYSIRAFGRDLSAVIEATVPAGETALVVGHSMGGMTVLSYVDLYPDSVDQRLAGVVLMSTGGSDLVTGGVVSVGKATLSGLRSRATRRAFEALGRRSGPADVSHSSSNDLSFMLTKLIGLSGDASPAHVAFTEQLLLDCPNTVKAAIGPMFTSLDLREAAPLVKVPALVMVGEHDRLTPARHAHRLMQMLPDAQLVELAGVGHMAPLEAHHEVTAHIRAFARRVWP